ncbi:MAG TPA: hypothetical protein VIF37_12715, partial [Methylobacter sp.]
KLDLNAQKTANKDNGNVIGLTSSYQTSNGVNHGMADVWFVADKNQNLQTQVSDLTQAISSYSAGDNTGGSTANQLTDPQQSTGQTVAGSVSGIVSTLNQFDANGNSILNTVQTSSALGVTGQSLVTNTQDPAKIGFLAS